jgi:6-phosphofructokinase
VAEGIVEGIPASALATLEGVERDAFGHIRIADVPIGSVLRDGVRRRLAEIGIDATVLAKDIGYELRCAKPVSFDVDYTRTLGYGAVRYLVGGGSGALIALSGGHVAPVALDELLDPKTGRIRTRQVDITSEAYRVARDYMVRLEAGDFEGERLVKLAAQTNLDPDAFRREFERVAAP